MIFRTLILTIFYLTAISFLSAQHQTLVPWKNEGKWGFCDTSGRTVVPAVYDSFGIPDTSFGRWHIPVYSDRYMNWVDNRGHLMFPFDSIIGINVWQLSQNRWAIYLQFGCGFKSMVVDEKFNQVFELLDGALMNARNGLEQIILSDDKDLIFYQLEERSCAQRHHKRMIDFSGHVLGDSTFRDVSFVYDGKFVGRPVKSGNYLIYNSKGIVIKTFPHKPVDLGRGGIIVVKVDQHFACTDFDGKLITKAIYKNYSNKRLYSAMQQEDDSWDVVHPQTGVVANIPKLDDAYIAATQAHFFVRDINGKWIGYNREGRQFSKKLYDSPPFVEKNGNQYVYRFKSGSDFVYTDLDGQERYIKPLFDQIFEAGKENSRYFNGFWITQRDTLFGLIRIYPDGRQQELFKPQFDIYRKFTEDGFATVKKNSKWGVIDTSGKVVLPFEYDRVTVSRSIKNPETVYFNVNKGNKWGKLDQTGRMLMPFVFSEDLFLKYYRWEPSPGPVRIWDGKIYVETSPGNFIGRDTAWSVWYSLQLKHGNEYHLVRKGNELGLLSNADQWLIPFTKNKIEVTSDGKLALVKDSSHTAIVDLRTKDTLTIVGDSLIPLVKDRYIIAFYAIANGRMTFAFWDTKRSAFVECDANFDKYKEYDNPYCTGCVSDDFVVIRNDSTHKSGIRRYNGSWLLPCEYDYIGKINDTYYEVKKDNPPIVRSNEEKYDFSRDLSHYSFCPQPECPYLPRPRGPFDLIDTAGNIVAKNFDALYRVGENIGYLEDDVLKLLPNENELNGMLNLRQMHHEEINDSLMLAGILTSTNCTNIYGITGIFKKDGTVIFPFSKQSKGYIPKIDKLYLKGKNGYAIYDLNGRRLTDDVFPSDPRPHLWYPDVFLVYNGHGGEVLMNWSGKVLGPVR